LGQANFGDVAGIDGYGRVPTDFADPVGVDHSYVLDEQAIGQDDINDLVPSSRFGLRR